MEYTNPTDIKTAAESDEQTEERVQLGLTDEAGQTMTALYEAQEAQR